MTFSYVPDIYLIVYPPAPLSSPSGSMYFPRWLWSSGYSPPQKLFPKMRLSSPKMCLLLLHILFAFLILSIDPKSYLISKRYFTIIISVFRQDRNRNVCGRFSLLFPLCYIHLYRLSPDTIYYFCQDLHLKNLIALFLPQKQ